MNIKNKAPIVATDINIFKLKEGYNEVYEYNLDKHAIDLDNDRIFFKVVQNYGIDVKINKYNDLVIPLGLPVGTYKVDFVASDGDLESEITTFNFEVINKDEEIIDEINHCPDIVEKTKYIELPKGYDTNKSINISSNFIDLDGDDLAYIIIDNGGTTISVDITSGVVTIPEGYEVGEYTVEIEAFDGENYSSTVKLIVTIK